MRRKPSEEAMTWSELFWSRKASKNRDRMDDDLIRRDFFLAGRSSTFCSSWPREAVPAWKRPTFGTSRLRGQFLGVGTAHHL